MNEGRGALFTMRPSHFVGLTVSVFVAGVSLFSWYQKAAVSKSSEASVEMAAGPATTLDKDREQFARALGEAKAATAKKDYDLAIACLTAALDLEPRSAEAYYERGFVYAHSGRPKLAVTDLNEAMQLDPKQKGVCLFIRADCHVKLGNLEQAIQDCSDVLRLGGVIPKVYCIRARAYLVEKKFTKAILDASEAIRLGSTDSEPHSLLAGAYCLSEQYDYAVRHATIALRLNPADSMSYTVRGLAQIKQRKYAVGISDALRALQLDPQNWSACEVLAEAYSDLGNIRTADRYHRKYLDLRPK